MVQIKTLQTVHLLRYRQIIDCTYICCIDIYRFLILCINLYYITHLLPIYQNNNINLSEYRYIISSISCKNNIISEFNINSIKKITGEIYFQESITQLSGLKKIYIVPSGEVLISDIVISNDEEMKATFKQQIENCNNAKNLSTTNTADIENRERLSVFFTEIINYGKNTNIQVEFIDKVSYDSFETVFKFIHKYIVTEGLDNSKLIFYISPGTAVSSTALGTLAIKDDRLILYNAQTKDKLQCFNPNTLDMQEYINKIDNDGSKSSDITD